MNDKVEPPLAPETEAEQPQRRPANKNPWYLLATLHGEQEVETGNQLFNEAQHLQNRLSWNCYIARGLREPERARLVALKDGDGNPRFTPEDLRPYNKVEHEKLLVLFRARLKKSLLEGESVPEDIKLPEGEADFSHTDFMKPFNATRFLFGNANFKSAVFNRYANFINAVFLNHALYVDVVFSPNADFRNVIFSSFATFGSARFQGQAIFENATFCDEANFHATFSTNANFVRSTFSGLAGFGRATFSKTPDFMNAQLKSRTIFIKAKFESCPPDFRGATLHEATEWHGVEWPPIPAKFDEAQWHLYCYERLKAEMERLKKHEDEHFFFMQEARCREVRDGFPGNIPSKLFGLFSDYGRSIARPMTSLMLIWFFGMNFLSNGIAKGDGGPLSAMEAASLSFANLFSFLPIRKEAFGEKFLESLSSLSHVISTGQSLAGLLFLFLIGLALRNRFRMK